MELFDECVIKYQNRPLFQTAKMRATGPINNTLENVACFYYVLKGRNEAIEGNGLTVYNKAEEESGDSPPRYIKNRRLDIAASRLLVDHESISSIAYDCGFQDVSTFSAVFRDRFDISPSKYRLGQMRK